MSQPIALSWANTSSIDPISGTLNKIAPQAQLQAIGWITGAKISAQNLNYILNNIFAWIAYLNTNTSPTPAVFTWVTVTSSTTASVSTGYLVENTNTPVTITLPSVTAVGNLVVVCSYTPVSTSPTALGFTVTAPAGQLIQPVGNAATQSLTFPQTGSSVFLVCAVPDSLWTIISSTGNYGLA